MGNLEYRGEETVGGVFKILGWGVNLKGGIAVFNQLFVLSVSSLFNIPAEGA